MDFVEGYIGHLQQKINKLVYLLSLTKKSRLRRKYSKQLKRYERRISFLKTRL